MWISLALLFGGFVGCMTTAMLSRRVSEDDIRSEVMDDLEKAMIEENLSPRTVRRVVERIKRKGGER